MFGLSRKTYEQAGINTEGNPPGSTKEPGIGWMTAFLSVSSFVGLLALVPLRKVIFLSGTTYVPEMFVWFINANAILNCIADHDTRL